MKSFRDLPIQKKLTLLIATTSVAMLLLSCVMLVTYDLVTLKRDMTQDLSIKAKIIGINSAAALTFKDAKAAQETLSALSAEPAILGACIYNKEGRIFASYSGSPLNSECPSHPESEGVRFRLNALILFQPIVFQNEKIGTIYIRSSLIGMLERLRLYSTIVIFILLVSFVIAFMLSSRIQRIISEPILDLTGKAWEISEHKNYSIRAEKKSRDEIGVLIDAFNEMLEQIQGRDIELQKARDELEQRVQDLARSNSELEQFAHLASHDLQEPLRSVTSFLQLLSMKYGGKMDPKADQYINYAVEGSKRMKDLIDALLTYSRLGSRKGHFETLNFSEALNHALKNLKVAIEESGAVVTFDPLPTLKADTTQIVELFQNLISNAIKFHDIQPPHVHVSCEKKQDEWIFSVRDNGIGIEPQYFERIFQMFQRLHTKEEFEGTGIGLTICKKIAENHGGNIWVQSERGKGATFYFSLKEIN